MPKMPTPRAQNRYKLTYFDIQGRGEVIRLCFRAAGVPFLDNRISGEEWQKLKEKTPYGGLPILEMEGQTFGESGAIMRWAARKFGLSGKTDADSLVVEAVLAQSISLLDNFVTWHFCKDEDKKKELESKFREQCTSFCKCWEAAAKEHQASSRTYTYIVGNSLTVADLAMLQTVTLLQRFPDFDLTPYKKLLNNKKTVECVPTLKDYLATRPAN